MASDALGPYKVVKCVDSTTYELESVVHPGDVRRVHARKILPFYFDESDLTLIEQIAAQDVQEYKVKANLRISYRIL